MGAKIDLEKKWRHTYGKHLIESVKLSAVSDANALKIAQGGLDYMYDAFDFTKQDGKVIKFKEALQSMKGTYHTGTVSGHKPDARAVEVAIPYKNFETGEFSVLKGQGLIDQVNRWVDYGTIEADCGEALKDVVKNPGWLDMKEHVFVLLGATSAMGPFQVLKGLGAHIVAVDLAQPRLWKRLIEEVQYNSHATLSFPMAVPYTGQQGDELYRHCGADLVANTPEIRNWLMSEIPIVAKGKHVTVGSYAYLDGELHVRVNLACDAIASGVLEAHGVRDTTLHYLPTPTDVYVIPEAANAFVEQNRTDAPAWMRIWSPVLSRGNKLVENRPAAVTREDGSTLHVIDGLMAGQGPNYAVAKRLQQWRAILTRAAGARVAFSVAPATATASVLSNKLFAAAYGGAHKFRPVEIFYQEFSSAVMAYLLVHDTHSPKSVADPKVPVPGGLMAWLSRKAFHGGFMRVAYKFDSIGEVAAALFYKHLAREWVFSRRGFAALSVAGGAALLYVGLQTP